MTKRNSDPSPPVSTEPASVECKLKTARPLRCFCGRRSWQKVKTQRTLYGKSHIAIIDFIRDWNSRSPKLHPTTDLVISSAANIATATADTAESRLNSDNTDDTLTHRTCTSDRSTTKKSIHGIPLPGKVPIPLAEEIDLKSLSVLAKFRRSCWRYLLSLISLYRGGDKLFLKCCHQATSRIHYTQNHKFARVNLIVPKTIIINK